MANADGKNSLKCQLCEKWVAKDNWTIKGHRGKCASDNMGLLITFDNHPEYYCSYCDGPVLLWPIRGPGFFESHVRQGQLIARAPGNRGKYRHNHIQVTLPHVCLIFV